MKERTLLFYSALFSPETMAIINLFLFCFYSPIGLGLLDSAGALLLSFMLLVIAPFSLVYRAWKKGETDLAISNRMIRSKFYLKWLPFFAASAIVFHYLQAQILVFASVLYGSLCLALYVVNRITKISIHTTGIAGLATSLTWVYGPAFALLYILIIPVALVRYKMNAHTLVQLVLGAIVGTAVTAVAYHFLY